MPLAGLCHRSGGCGGAMVLHLSYLCILIPTILPILGGLSSTQSLYAQSMYPAGLDGLPSCATCTWGLAARAHHPLRICVPPFHLSSWLHPTALHEESLSLAESASHTHHTTCGGCNASFILFSLTSGGILLQHIACNFENKWQGRLPVINRGSSRSIFS